MIVLIVVGVTVTAMLFAFAMCRAAANDRTDFERAMDDLEQAYGRAPEEE